MLDTRIVFNKANPLYLYLNAQWMQKGVLKKPKSWLESLGLDCLPWSSYPVFCRILICIALLRKIKVLLTWNNRNCFKQCNARIKCGYVTTWVSCQTSRGLTITPHINLTFTLPSLKILFVFSEILTKV